MRTSDFFLLATIGATMFVFGLAIGSHVKQSAFRPVPPAADIYCLVNDDTGEIHCFVPKAEAAE